MEEGFLNTRFGYESVSFDLYVLAAGAAQGELEAVRCDMSIFQKKGVY